MRRFLAALVLLAVVHAADLPDPLAAADGSKITTAEQWREKRRPELLEFFTREMYGRNPGRPEKLVSEVFDREPQALGARRRGCKSRSIPAASRGHGWIC